MGNDVAESRNTVVARAEDSLAGELRRPLPELRQAVGEGRVMECFDRGSWSPALFADILAGFNSRVLAYCVCRIG